MGAVTTEPATPEPGRIGINAQLHIGTRVAQWRVHRGLTQEELGGLTGYSQSYVSKIETGEKTLDQRKAQVRFATALQISTNQLLGIESSDPIDPARTSVQVHLPALRSTLIGLSVGERTRPARDMSQLLLDVAHLTQLRNGANYSHLVPELPGLLSDLAGHRLEVAGPALIETLFAARYALRVVGQPDLAWQAAQLGMEVAREHGDPAWIGLAAYSRVQVLPPEQAELGAKLAAAAAEQLQHDASRSGQEMYGCLHLLAGYQQAIAGNGGLCTDHMSEAAQMAAVLGEPQRSGNLTAGFNGNWFGPTQTLIWRLSAAAELGDTSAAMAAARATDLNAMPVPNRHVYYWTDLARAHALAGEDIEALTALAHAERSAPQHFRLNPIAPSLVTAIIRRAQRRAVTRDMTALARKLGIHPI